MTQPERGATGGRSSGDGPSSRTEGAMITYKVEELSIVTAETIQAALNRHAADGWRLDSIQFAMGPASKRPAMAFILFIREDDDDHRAQEG